MSKRLLRKVQSLGNSVQDPERIRFDRWILWKKSSISWWMDINGLSMFIRSELNHPMTSYDFMICGFSDLPYLLVTSWCRICSIPAAILILPILDQATWYRFLWAAVFYPQSLAAFAAVCQAMWLVDPCHPRPAGTIATCKMAPWCVPMCTLQCQRCT